MRTESILKKAVAGLGSAALVIAMSACAHHDVAADAQGYGQIRTEAPATADASGTTIGTVSAPVNTAGVGSSSTPAAISGPAAVDNTGRAYTSSSAGGTGNGSGIGTNTNVNLIPKKSSSDVTVTQYPATVDTTASTMTTDTTVITPAAAPAPVIVETPAPAPVIVETPAPMSSSTTETQTTTTDTTTTDTTTTRHHRRMHKD
jgi:hypothetical protein